MGTQVYGATMGTNTTGWGGNKYDFCVVKIFLSYFWPKKNLLVLIRPCLSDVISGSALAEFYVLRRCADAARRDSPSRLIMIYEVTFVCLSYELPDFMLN